MAKEKENKQEVVSSPPTGMQVVWREFKKDKVALVSLFGLIITIIAIFITALFFLDKKEVMYVSLLDMYAPPGPEHWLGADVAGRDVFGQLMIGAKNSIVIAIAITVITGVFGVFVGLVCGYFGGIIDNVFMRIIDFFITIPQFMIIIVMITMVKTFNAYSFIAIMSIFLWTGTARVIRSKALSESRRDYVNASKTLGTNDFIIIVKEIMPNLSSIIIVELTLHFAGNIGIETGLTFLGFGLPSDTPSLGTLVSFARTPLVIEQYWWVWLPASLLILFLMLSINYIGQALRRAADVRQRLG